MPAKKTLNQHLFDALDRISNASGEQIQDEVDKAATIISLSQEVRSVAQTKLAILESQGVNGADNFTEFIEYSDANLLENNSEPDEEFEKKLKSVFKRTL